MNLEYEKTQNKKCNEGLLITGCLIFSAGAGIMSKDLWIGGSILATGLISAYYASHGKRINYLLGFANYLLMAYVSWQNHIYGMFLSYALLFAPLQLKGFFAWKKETGNDKQEVSVRRFTLKKSLGITGASIVCSLTLGYVLSQIPSQQLSYLDAFANCINFFGVILMIQRHEEAFWLWLINNTADLIIWTLLLIRGGEGAFMMFLASVGFLLINIYGIVNWHRKAKSNPASG